MILQSINHTLSHAKNAPFYQSRIPQHSLSQVQQLKEIPLTTKDDLIQYSPYGLVAVPAEELYQYHESSGTTGKPVSSWFTEDDMKLNALRMADSGIQFHAKDQVLIRFPYALSTISHLLHAAAHQKKACVIPASARTPICPLPRVIELMSKLNVTVLCCISLQALMLAETAKILGYDPAKDFPHLRAICTAGEPLLEGRRKLIENTWGVPVFDFYGMTETGNVVEDCEFGNPHVAEEDFFIEILDDQLLLEVEDGNAGNLVITTLNKKGSPVIRYVTNDQAVVFYKDCPCGQNKHIQILGRNELSFSVGEQLFNLWDIDKLLSQIPHNGFWVVAPLKNKLKIVVESGKHNHEMSTTMLNLKGVLVEAHLVSSETLFSRNDFLSVGLTSKPSYILSEEELMKFIR